MTRTSERAAPMTVVQGGVLSFALLYLVATLLAALWWLEPELSARAVDAPRLLLLGALISPPFVACGMVVTHLSPNNANLTQNKKAPEYNWEHSDSPRVG